MMDERINENKDRYFFVSFWTKVQNGQGVGDLSLCWSGGFPNSKWIREYIATKNKCIPEDVVIASIFEFNNEQDYRDFIKKD